MNNETMLTNFAIWLQATHSEETGLKDNKDTRFNELAREWLDFANEKNRRFPGYDEETDTCDYCVESTEMWHCHNCGYYVLNANKVCSDCKIVRPSNNLTRKP